MRTTLKNVSRTFITIDDKPIKNGEVFEVNELNAETANLVKAGALKVVTVTQPPKYSTPVTTETEELESEDIESEETNE